MAGIAPWLGFVALVLVMVGVDLGLGRRRGGAMSVRSALAWSGVWVALSVAFGLVVWRLRGGDAAEDFFTAYLLEKSLSVDNLFVFLVVFGHYGVPEEQRHRVLSWGVLGALVLRAAMIFAGLELVQRVHAVTYALAAFLAFTAVRTMVPKPETKSEARAEWWLVRAVRRVVPFVPGYDGGRFVTRDARGRRAGTLLLWALVVVEGTDVVFALDSLPATFGVTTDPFIVFTSNVLALLGMRALFIALAGLLERLRYLRYGLGAVLLLVAAKMALADVVHVPHAVALGLTALVLVVTTVASLAHTKESSAVGGEASAQ